MLAAILMPSVMLAVMLAVMLTGCGAPVWSHFRSYGTPVWSFYVLD